MKPKYRVVRHVEKAVIVGSKIAVADTWLSRLRGLLGTTHLGEQEGLLITPSSGVHTLGMSFSIDVIELETCSRALSSKVLRVWPNLEPNRTTGIHWRTRSILELPAGKVLSIGIAAGDHLEISIAA
jgi:uncharacterized protein